MAVKILSVDDEQDLEILLAQFFRRKIRSGEYEFTFAHNGLEALQLVLDKKDFDIILSDINMPEMDGLTLLTRLNELQNPGLKCIIVSAYGDMANIRTAMNNGAFDFATKPIDLNDLSVTIEKAIEQINYVKASEKEHSQLESIKGDLAVAGEIQQAILPRIFPPFPQLVDKIDIFASMTPAKEVGGDFYDFFQIDDNRIGFVIADVSGKGVPASLFMAVSRTMLRSTGLRGVSSEECLTETNKFLSRESLDSMFVTMFYGIYSLDSGVIDYTNAGHNPPYLLKHDNSVEQLSSPKNFVAGAFEDFKFTSSTLTLEPGDTLVLYTDGVTEAFNEQGEMFNESGLEKTLASVPGAGCQEITEAIQEDIKDFVGNEPQSDDITTLLLKRLS